MERNIIDITAENLYQVPAARGNNPIDWIVIHYLGVPNADNPYLYGGGYGGHFNITRDGQIYEAADPKTAVVWHCGGKLQSDDGHEYYGICTNYNSIGIENGVNYDGTWYFSEETQVSLIFLVSKLMDDYNIDINHVIRHFDVTGKYCPMPYVINDNYKTNWTWDQFKSKLADYHDRGIEPVPVSDEPHIATVFPPTPFSVEVLIDDLNMRQGPGNSYPSNGYTGKAIFTIVATSGNWGKLKSGAGWIYLTNPNYCTVLDGGFHTGYIFEGLDYSPVFEPNFYANNYPDLMAAFGTDALKLFNHFCTYGMNEARQAIATFNVIAYKNYYEDLRNAFGSDLPAYYRHYIEYGQYEGRKTI